jgi:hypothetical protein
MAVLAAQLSGGERRADDFYPTPASAVHALLPFIREWRDLGPVWEPACGDGAISSVLIDSGHRVISTDLVYRGFGRGEVDFLAAPPLADTIVTNPPFNLAAEFIRRANAIGVERMALLLKSDYWAAATRRSLFETWRPTVIAPLTWRLDFTGQGRPHTNCAWNIWEGHPRTTEYVPIARPLPASNLGDM